MTKSRTDRAERLEAWAETVAATDLREADTAVLRTIGELVERRDDVDASLTAAVEAARRARRSWSEIGMMLGVSKQAAERKYGHRLSA